jgi:uncharacterized protein (TIGR03437 family)
MTSKSTVLFPLLFLSFLSSSLIAQPRRITRPINDRDRASLPGHVHPKARPEFDQGRVSPSQTLSYVTLTLAQSAEQKADLERLLVEQQTPGSPNYHHWLTPEEFAQRFGTSDSDIQQITAWLQGQGLTVAAVARGRGWIAFNGTASQVEAAFGTQLHNYLLDGELHFANATEPSIPAAITDVVSAIRGLHNFRPQARAYRQAAPDYNSSHGNHYLAPNDLATIYNITPLLNAGITGSGQNLVIAGQTRVVLSNVQQFRNAFNLPPNDPQIMLVPGSADPGVLRGDVDEAHLDLEWAGAVARNARILYVYSSDVFQSLQYAIDQNLAPVVSESYGECEVEAARSDVVSLRSWAQQANAQGITWFAPSGDSGAADCNSSQDTGFSVDLPSSIPEVTAVGGTQFQEGTAQYWNSTNDISGASALSYIPEAAWNDSVSQGQPSATGGGASIYFTKPYWQSVPGVPGDNVRHVPDISLNASPGHDGYLVYSSGGQQVFGGTSVPTPIFAGIAALLNQYLSAGGVGNINPRLYALAQTAPDVFHDVAAGDNIVTVSCPTRSRGCVSSPVGYSASLGYDQVTGLGSVDVYKLISNWNNTNASGSGAGRSLSIIANLSAVAVNDAIQLIATATDASGVTPSGTVQFTAGGVNLGSVPLGGSGGTATATLNLSGSQIPAASNITATYSDATAYIALPASILPRTSNASPSIAGVTNGASFKAAFAPGELISVFGSQLASSTQVAGSVPLPVTISGVTATVNGIIAPLYYSSAGQLNLQIPYGIPGGTNASLSVNSNGQVTSQSISIAAAAPGIFTDQSGALVPNASARVGQTISLYLTGGGDVSPSVATGGAPSLQTSISALPRVTQSLGVSVGGVQAPISFSGIAPGLVGVVQVNFQIPNGVPLGPQQVIVTVGTTTSPPATLNITN